ncbi:hypothetical protein HQ545_03600 [Candidatus Woesearchaeota archaeon]|nr:hypothetical protein [Candidatus Woesearchaeota archaeon]
MKHIFTYIDTVEVLLKHVPLSLDAPKDIAKAENILTKIEKYTHLLKGLVKTHKNEKYLKKLKNAHIKEVENWAEKVEGLFKKFEEYLNILETDCKVLRDVIKNHPEKWSSKVRDLSFGLIMIGLDDEEEDMKRFRKIAIFEIEELKSVIDIEKHIHLSNTNDLLIV